MRSVVRPGLRAARTRLATHAAAPVRLCSSSAPSSSDSTSPPSIVERASKLFEQPAARKAGSEKMLDKMREGTGWREALESGLYEQQKMQRQDDVREQLNKMASMESFGFDELAGQLRHSLEQLEQGMTTFQRARLFADKMSGGNTSDNIEQQKAKAISKLKILDELNPHEKRKPKLLDPPARRAIAAKLGIEVLNPVLLSARRTARMQAPARTVDPCRRLTLPMTLGPHARSGTSTSCSSSISSSERSGRFCAVRRSAAGRYRSLPTSWSGA